MSERRIALLILAVFFLLAIGLGLFLAWHSYVGNQASPA